LPRGQRLLRPGRPGRRRAPLGRGLTRDVVFGVFRGGGCRSGGMRRRRRREARPRRLGRMGTLASAPPPHPPAAYTRQEFHPLPCGRGPFMELRASAGPGQGTGKAGRRRKRGRPGPGSSIEHCCCCLAEEAAAAREIRGGKGLAGAGRRDVAWYLARHPARDGSMEATSRPGGGGPYWALGTPRRSRRCPWTAPATTPGDGPEPASCRDRSVRRVACSSVSTWAPSAGTQSRSPWGLRR